MKILRDNSLTIVLVSITLLCLVGMALAGLSVENDTLLRHGGAPIGMATYLRSGSFLSALFENWESEFLQMAAYVVLTAWLFQRGSAESRDPDRSERRRDGPSGRVAVDGSVWRWLYSHSLGLALVGLFLASFVLHWHNSLRAANQEAALHGRPGLDALSYLSEAQLWFESFQNWQSEFLSTATLVVLSIFLRHRGSPESKPVGAAHSETGA